MPWFDIHSWKKEIKELSSSHLFLSSESVSYQNWKRGFGKYRRLSPCISKLTVSWERSTARRHNPTLPRGPVPEWSPDLLVPEWSQLWLYAAVTQIFTDWISLKRFNIIIFFIFLEFSHQTMAILHQIVFACLLSSTFKLCAGKPTPNPNQVATLYRNLYDLLSETNNASKLMVKFAKLTYYRYKGILLGTKTLIESMTSLHPGNEWRISRICHAWLKAFCYRGEVVRATNCCKLNWENVARIIT